jgi:hypothetical protein
MATSPRVEIYVPEQEQQECSATIRFFAESGEPVELRCAGPFGHTGNHVASGMADGSHYQYHLTWCWLR